MLVLAFSHQLETKKIEILVLFESFNYQVLIYIFYIYIHIHICIYIFFPVVLSHGVCRAVYVYDCTRLKIGTCVWYCSQGSRCSFRLLGTCRTKKNSIWSNLNAGRKRIKCTHFHLAGSASLFVHPTWSLKNYHKQNITDCKWLLVLT